MTTTNTTTQTQAQTIREELLAIAAERGIDTNSHWNTRTLANRVTEAVLERRATMHQRAWESRRRQNGQSGLRAFRHTSLQPEALSAGTFWEGR